MKYINILNKIIEYSFYALFFLVPLVLYPNTSELFEFNKMWLTFALSLLILAAWASKMVLKREFKIQRTPLDIPIVLFLLSQIISSIFTLDQHVSLWGYYSRFNGGLFSILAYIFLYYAFVSNFRENAKKIVKRLVYVIVSSGVLVALWGLPSHFGYDPTCFVFRGTFDVSCWTSAFQPKVRIFSTLGQPDWMAAYLAVLLPIVAALFIKTPVLKTLNNKKTVLSKKNLFLAVLYFLIFILFYLDLLYTGSRSGVLALWAGAAFFALAYYFIEKRTKEINLKKPTLDFKFLGLAIIGVLVITFIVGSPFQQLNILSFNGLKQHFSKPAVTKHLTATPTPAAPSGQELGGTDSGKIRLIVWRGAIDAWLHNPIFGTGVETFAFAYYKYRPAAHNMTSEWNYLYNKAHNEYLNYLTTTGAFGLLTYLSMIFLFLYLSYKFLLKNKTEDTNNRRTLLLALIAGYLTILVSNFFGFSVVIINLFIFIIPALVLTMSNLIDYDKTVSFSFIKKANEDRQEYPVTKLTLLSIAVIVVAAGYFVYMLFVFWQADQAYAYGYNLDRAQNYQEAYPYLHEAVLQRPGEPTFKDELSINDAVLAIDLLREAQQNPKVATQAASLAQKLAQEAVTTSDQVTSEHPNDVVFWKTRVRVFYTLAQADSQYFPLALDAIKKAAVLAPTDPDVSYNMGILYGQNGDVKEAVSTLENTIKLKPDYNNGQAYYALGIFYHQLAINEKGAIVNQQYETKAINAMKEMLKYSPGDSRALDALKAWGASK